MHGYPPTMRRILLVLAVVALVVTGCRAESVTRVRIEADGTASVISEGAFDAEALELIGQVGDTPDDVLASLADLIDPSLLPVPVEDAVAEQFSRGDLQGLRVELAGLNASEVARQIGSNNSIVEDVVFRVADGELTMSASTRTISDFERARLQALAPGDLSQILTLVLQVEVPGTVTEHTADRVLADGVLEWDLLPAITEGRAVVVSLLATVDPDFVFVDLEGRPLTDAADPPDVESSGVAWPLVVIAIVVGGGASYFIIRRLQNRRLSEIEGFTPRG